MSDLKAERYITALAEHKTIRKAAQKLYISPSALSMYVKHLEEELGAPLFLRNKKNFTPTVIGEKYIRRCYQLLKTDQEFKEELEQWLRREHHHISVGIYRRRGISFLVPLMKSLKEILPDITFSFRLGSVRELELLLENRQIDYILITHRLHTPGFRYEYICSDRLLLACPLSWEHEMEVAPDGLRLLLPIEKVLPDQILMPGSGQSLYPFVSHFLEEHKVPGPLPSPASNMEIHMQSVSAQLGCCFTLASYVPTFSHISGLLFASPAVNQEPVNWSLASLESADSHLDARQLSIFKTAVHNQIAQMM